MFTMAMGLKGQAKLETMGSQKAARLAAVLGSLILTSVAVNSAITLADRNLAQSTPKADCSAIAENTGRLACYDKLADQPALHPFRDANAPALHSAL